MNDLQKQKIEYLRGRGESYAAIAEALGISINTVKSYCRRNGLGAPDQVGCARCGKPLIHTLGAKKKRFCCDKCRMAWWVEHPESVNRQATYHFVCPACGKEFTAYGNAKRKYCSRACASAAKKASL